MKVATSIFWAVQAAVSLCLAQAPPAPATGARELFVTVGKSVLVDSPIVIQRVSVANGDVAEAVAVTPREVLVNGKAAGETSLIVWQQDGNRLFFDLTVQPNESRVDAVRHQMDLEMGNRKVTLDLEGNNVFLRGDVTNLTEANRAVMIASTLGKPVNLLRVDVPNTDLQVLLKVRFADVDRSAMQQLGTNWFSTGTGNTVGTVSTQQFPGPTASGNIGASGSNALTLSNVLNVFLFRTDLNLGATIQALASRNLLQILAEPNVLAIDGHPASFLAGGEFPYPTLQGGGAGLGAVTIQFRQFGVRISFTPHITPRGSIRLTVAPEVSSLDYANGLNYSGVLIPGLSTRRVETEIELNDGQSFAIGGLLDNRTTEALSRIPGLGDIPFLGRLFRSRQTSKNNTELLVMVTPEIVRPIPKGKPLPQLKFPEKFMPPNTSSTPPQTPGVAETGPETKTQVPPIPVEALTQAEQQMSGGTQQQAAPIQFVPVPLMPTPINPSTQAQPTPTPAPTPAPQTPGNQPKE